MSDTRAEVEKELERMRDRYDHARQDIAQQRESIRLGMVGDFDSVSLVSGTNWLRSKEENVRLYSNVIRILQGILDRSKEPPAVEGEP